MEIAYLFHEEIKIFKMVFNIYSLNKRFFQRSLTSFNLLTADLTVAAAVVEYTQAPPATILLHLLHVQIPTTDLFMAS